ncbi:hypothetical protein EDC17_102615 [Sphingobacterium alimentarium]|uniref:Uncharacterized protein n=1 Tax=Sphingobacterium alimentarium TaxID=797292 RepID=A0A4R3VS55_9SPHI|nr:hypothetical protein [Sphingobacterium alimentarium]TCV11832.1 hypothetical protein EDC17_102615 [Sphingobacterium alimentarium]
MNKNSIIAGIIVGAIAPLLAYLVMTYTTLQQSYFAEKPIALYVLAAVVNLVIIRFAYRGQKEALAKGVVLITFLAMIAFVVLTKFKI